MKKIFIFIITLIMICGCSTHLEKKAILNKKQIDLEIFYHHFDEEDNDLWLVSCYVYFKDKTINLDNVSIDIMGLDNLGKVDVTLSEDPVYTSQYCQDKIFPDEDEHIITKMFVMKSEFDESLMKFDKIKANIQYGEEMIQKNVDAIMEI